MKPFSTPVLSKRTYRELKLLKHIQHENVLLYPLFVRVGLTITHVDHQSQRRFHLSSGRSVGVSLPRLSPPFIVP